MKGRSTGMVAGLLPPEIPVTRLNGGSYESGGKSTKPFSVFFRCGVQKPR